MWMTVPTSPVAMGEYVEISMQTTPASVLRRTLESSANYVRLQTIVILFHLFLTPV